MFSLRNKLKQYHLCSLFVLCVILYILVLVIISFCPSPLFLFPLFVFFASPYYVICDSTAMNQNLFPILLLSPPSPTCLRCHLFQFFNFHIPQVLLFPRISFLLLPFSFFLSFFLLLLGLVLVIPVPNLSLQTYEQQHESFPTWSADKSKSHPQGHKETKGQGEE